MYFYRIFRLCKLLLLFFLAALISTPVWGVRVKDVAKLRKTFAMYVKFPKNRWPEIKKAEDDSELHAKLSAEYIDTFWNEEDDDLREAAKGFDVNQQKGL